MPVSSPSYFPPQRNVDRIVGLNAGSGQTGNRVFLAGLGAGAHTTQSDMVIVGDSAFSTGTAAAPLNDANFQGNTIYGSQAGVNVASQGTGVSTENGPVLLVGYNALNAAVYARSTIVIGCNAMPNAAPTSTTPVRSNVVIGNNIYSGSNTSLGASGFNSNVVIGHGAIEAPQQATDGVQTSVIIGMEAAKNFRVNGTNGISRDIVIGYQAGTNLSDNGNGTGDNIIIGGNAGPNIGGNLNTIVGTTSGSGDGLNGTTVIGGNSTNNGQRCVVVGSNSLAGTGQDTIVVGSNAGSSSLGANNTIVGNFSSGSGAASGTIAIGTAANSGFGTTNDLCAIGTNVSGVAKGCLYSDMNAGNVILGNSTSAGGSPNRDFAGSGATQIVKLLNGTKGSANPLGGGYFYVASGALHWVGTSGTDTTIAPA